MPNADFAPFAGLLAGGCLIFALITAALTLVVAIFYILSMQKALTLAGPQHRKLEPAMAWLLLIPLFNLVWHFFVVKHVSDAIRNWAAARGVQVDDAGYTFGLITCIANCCAIIPIVSLLAGPTALVCFIIWWVKVAGFNRTMGSQPA